VVASLVAAVVGAAGASAVALVAASLGAAVCSVVWVGLAASAGVVAAGEASGIVVGAVGSSASSLGVDDPTEQPTSSRAKPNVRIRNFIKLSFYTILMIVRSRGSLRISILSAGQVAGRDPPGSEILV
jgi:hypothetical protein